MLIAPVADLLDIDWILLAVAGWLIVGAAGIPNLKRFRTVTQVLFPLGGVIGLLLAAVSLRAISAGPQTAVLAIGLPMLPFHLRLDALSAYFLFVIGGVGAGVSLFAAGYFRRGEGTPPGLLCLEYHLFLACMALVVLADDAYAFMVAWEGMALASYFLVTSNHRVPEIRRAGFLYLLIAHVGALGILLCFGVLQANTGDYSFANMRSQSLSPFWASVAFCLALFGFGAKAGLLPLHVWLPEAHPAAPSPVSALMSAVMLKTAIYGLLRVTFDLAGMQLWWWGAVLLALGLASALFGVIYAAVQTDMKRLLAYSSIENIGLITVGIGLATLFAAYRMPALAALALTAALYQVLAHAYFKSLLFLGTGAVLHATSERNLGHLGGLARYMPWVAYLVLAGVLASSGLPPFSGFVAEWLLLQGFLFSPGLPDSFLNMLVPVATAGIALVAALAGYVMVKFFGVIFLGQPREEKLARAHDAGFRERLGMLWLAVIGLLLGLLPTVLVRLIDPVTQGLVGDGIGARAAETGWWLLAPTSVARASYGPIVFLLGVLLAAGAAFAIVRSRYPSRRVRGAPWDCGYPFQTPRMQDTADGFGQPIRQIFEPFFRLRRELPSPFDAAPRYRVVVEDPLWHRLYLPVVGAVEFVAGKVSVLQRGRISTYLMFSFVTLVGLLLWVTR